MTDNPWRYIPLDTYERHMGSEEVMQQQALNRIMGEQLGCGAATVAILGAAGGNGLEHWPALHRDVCQVELEQAMASAGYRVFFLGETDLPDGKTFLRLDFKGA